MSAGRKFALLVVAILLVTTVGAANVVMTAEKTALNAEFVDQSLTEEDGYSQLRSVTVDAIDEEVQNASPTESDRIPGSLSERINTTAIVREAVTEEYVRNQSQANLYRLYDYLHGERASPDLRVDLVPLKASLADAVGDEVGSVDLSTLVDEYAPSTESVPIEISGNRFSRMRASESGYQEVRRAFRDEVRAVLFERLRSEEPGLLLEAVGINPNQYSSDAERRQAVDDNEAEIRQRIRELTRQGANNDIKQRFDRELAERADDAKDRVRQETRERTGEFSPNVTQAAIDIQVAVIDGLATDTSYQEFSTRIDSAEQTLINEASRLARQQINEEVPDNISAAEQLSPSDREQLTTLSNRVQQVDSVNGALPIVALVLVALLYLVSRSLETTALTTGLALGGVGGASYAGATLAQSPVEDVIREQISGEDVQAIQELAIGLVGQTLGVLQSQSLLLLVAGVVLVALAIASRLGAFAGLRERVGGQESGAGAGTAAGHDHSAQPSDGQQGQPPAGGTDSFEGPGRPPRTDQQGPGQSPEQTQPGRAPGEAGLADEGVEPLEVGGDDTRAVGSEPTTPTDPAPEDLSDGPAESGENAGADGDESTVADDAAGDGNDAGGDTSSDPLAGPGESEDSSATEDDK
jgi:hypothetical protein